MNCLTYALPLWHKYGGHLQLRKSKELDVAHVVWISPEGKMLHYAPPRRARRVGVTCSCSAPGLTALSERPTTSTQSRCVFVACY